MAITVLRSLLKIITSLQMAAEVAAAGGGDRVYDIKFGDVKFRGYIRSDGGLLIASTSSQVTPGTEVSNNPIPLDKISDAVLYGSNSIFNETILAAIPDLTRVRIKTHDDEFFVINSNDSDVANRIKSYINLTQSPGDQSKFQVVTNPNSIPLVVQCQPLQESLDRVIYHGCGNLNRLHWFGKYSAPSSNFGDHRAMDLVVYNR